MLITSHIRIAIENVGWVIECESPLEISYGDTHFARGFMAEYAVKGFMAEYAVKGFMAEYNNKNYNTEDYWPDAV